jgi:hypothetical protein
MKEITHEDRMEIVEQMLYWAHTRGVNNVKDLSIIYIGKGYNPAYIRVLEIAAKNLYVKYLAQR